MKRMAISGIGSILLVGLAGIAVSAQEQSSTSSPSETSLGAYARHVRKDPEAAKAKPKVFDNDNLPREDKLSVVGKPGEVADAQAQGADTQNASTPAGDAKTEAKPAAAPDKSTEKSAESGAAKPPEDEATRQAAWKQWGDKIAAQQQSIDLLQRELDVLQREYQIRAAAMYGDVGNRLRNSGDWDKQDADYKQKISDKEKALDDAKQKLDDVREEARKAGVPSSVREP